jgi:hypothetical protein
MLALSQFRRPSGHSRGRALTWIALGVLMTGSAAVILYLGRDLTFFRDEWMFVLYRDGHEPLNLISSHAGHLMLWPVGLYVFLFRTVGLDHYEAYRVVALPTFLACAALVYLLSRRRIGDLAALAPAAILLFLGSSWMDILWPFQIGFTGAIAFGLGALLFIDRNDLRGDVLACLCLLIAIGWSGAALPAIPAVAAGLLVRHRFWRRVWVVAAPAAAYLLWALKYGQQHVDYAENLPHVPGYALKMAGAGITGISGLPASLGPALALILGALAAVRLWQVRRRSPLAWEAAAMTVSLLGLTALARAQEHDPTAVRYVYPSAISLLLLAVGLAPKGNPGRWATAAILALAALTMPSNIAGLQDGREDLRFTSDITSAELGALELARNSVAPEYSPEMNLFGGVPSAAFFAATDRYGSSPADSPQEIASSPEVARRRADATSIAALHVRLREAPARTGLAINRGRCVKLSDQGGAGAESIVPRAGLLIQSDGGSAELGLRRFANGFHPLSEEVPPRSTKLLRIPADGERHRPWRILIVASKGEIAVCRVSAGASRAGVAR